MTNHIKIGKKILLSVTILAIVLTLSGIFFLKPKAQAVKVILKDNDLYLLNNILNEKRLTANGDIKLLFDQKNGQILFGRGWEGSIPNSEQIGGAKLYVIQEDGTNTRQITDELVTRGFFDQKGEKIFYATSALDLYMSDIKKNQPVKLQEKVLSPSVSNDGNFMVYVKVNSDWQEGQYYDQALGITVLNLKNGEEKLLTRLWEDFNPTWTPDSKKILFFSRSREGLASHFIINADGSNRRQLTNVGEKFVSDKTVAIPGERVVWSSHGKYAVYESDRQIWLNEFDTAYENIIQSKPIAYGRNPQWLVDGKIISIVIVPSNNDLAQSVIKINLKGEIIK